MAAKKKAKVEVSKQDQILNLIVELEEAREKALTEVEAYQDAMDDLQDAVVHISDLELES